MVSIFLLEILFSLNCSKLPSPVQGEMLYGQKIETIVPNSFQGRAALRENEPQHNQIKNNSVFPLFTIIKASNSVVYPVFICGSHQEFLDIFFKPICFEFSQL